MFLARFSTRETSQIRELERALATVSDGGASALTWIMPALRDVLGSEKGLAGGYLPRGDELGIAFGYLDRIDNQMIQFMDRWLVGKGVAWTGFNPVRPEPSQRNVALDISEILSASRLVTVPPVVTEVYSRYGLGSDANMRVLVCEGPSLLAWIGVFQAGAILPRQRRIMTRLIAPMRRRFSVERLLSTGVGSAVLLLAALEEISAPAFVTDEQGVVLEANRVGTEWLAGDRLHKRRMLRDVVCVGGLARVGFRVTRVASPGAAVRFLVVGGRTESSDHRIRVAAREWRLSPRETQILTLLCDGLTTRTLAAQLGVSERTVGAHLTSMFEKAQVESRAELVVQALRRPLS